MEKNLAAVKKKEFYTHDSLFHNSTTRFEANISRSNEPISLIF